MIVTVVSWEIFLRFLRGFRGESYLRVQQEHAQQLRRHTALLERIAAALEKTGVYRPVV